MKNFLLAALTGILLFIGWPTSPFTYLLFVAFIPLLFVEKNIRNSNIKKKGFKFLMLAWCAFAIFNVTGTWWVKNAHWSGTVATTIINGFLMAAVFFIYHKAAQVLGQKRALFTLPFIWICIELLHQDWQVSFPWLDLGNGLSTHVQWIQWYEYTGHMGGTLWIWLVNLALFKALILFNRGLEKKKFAFYLLSRLAFWFGIPVIISTWMYVSYQEQGQKVNVLVIQPNIDSYTEKFELSEQEQVHKFIRLATPFLNDSIDYLVGPETMLVDGIDEDFRERSIGLRMLKRLVTQYPNLNIVAGAVSYKTYAADHKTSISRKSSSGMWYDLYNTSFQVNQADSIPFYHKSKLVVAAEYMPFMDVLKPLLGDVVIDLGGMVGSHGTQKNREVFVSNNSKVKIGTSICWEAEFGEFMTGFAQQGANLIFAITNDGWWGNTDGHRQHMHYASMRAIETRRSVARSANTGISCFINQRGDISQKLPWAEDGAIVASLHTNNQLTFYAKWGDIIGRVSLFVLIFTVLYILVQGVLKKKKTESEI